MSIKLPTAAEMAADKKKHWKEFKEFLEKSPLQKKVIKDLNLDEMNFNNLMLVCRTCKDDTTHHYIENDSDIKNSTRSVYSKNKHYTNGTYKLVYECQHCQIDRYTFLISVSPVEFFKSGQNPSMVINIPKDIELKLGTLIGLYRKGKICYSHGFGIGAMAYYRRVTEDKLKELLSEVSKILPESEKAEYEKVVDEVSDLHSFKERASFFTQAMPPVLNSPNGNYFQLLFSAVSENLHSKTDSECLEQAEMISEILELIIHKIDSEVVAAKSLERFSKKINETKVKK